MTRSASVDFPAPEAPTIAVVRPEGMSIVTRSSDGAAMSDERKDTSIKTDVAAQCRSAPCPGSRCPLPARSGRSPTSPRRTTATRWPEAAPSAAPRQARDDSREDEEQERQPGATQVEDPDGDQQDNAHRTAAPVEPPLRIRERRQHREVRGREAARRTAEAADMRPSSPSAWSLHPVIDSAAAPMTSRLAST